MSRFFMSNTHIYERMKVIRLCLNMSQTDFGRAIGKGLRAIQHYEAGERKIDDTIIILLEAKFGVNSNWLRNGEGEIFIQTQQKTNSKRRSQKDIFIISALESGMVSEADKDFVIKFLQEKQELAELRSKSKKEGTTDS